jgi:threonyl-tRNA synthetase
MSRNNEKLLLRPMSCPHHCSIFKYHSRSYRELPLRISEHANLFRYESSGSLTGLERVRQMELTDAHLFVMKSQLKQEIKSCYLMIAEILKTFGIKISYLSLSLRDAEDKNNFYPDDEM